MLFEQKSRGKSSVEMEAEKGFARKVLWVESWIVEAKLLPFLIINTLLGWNF